MSYMFIVLFLIAIVAVYFGMHYYTIYRVLGFFSIKYNIILLAGVLTFIYPAATIIDRFFHSIITRIFYFIASSLAGILFILFFSLIFLELVNLFFPLFGKITVGVVLIFFILFVSLHSIINASKIQVKEVNIDDFGTNIRVVQLSDVHIGTVRNSEFLNRIIKKTNSLNPDVVVITGDLVDGSGKLSEKTFEPLNKINAPTFIIMGNHEFYEGEQRVIDLIASTKAKILRNKNYELDTVNIIGLDYSENKTYVADNLKNIHFNISKPTILLNHVPIGYEDAEKLGVKLQLSGHTHNGQMFPFTLFVKLRFSKINGLYEIGKMKLYVSSGTGTWGPPMRLGSKNEITLINLKK